MGIRILAGFLGTVARAMMLPGPTLDFYFKDRYVPVSKRSLILVTLVVGLIPVFAVAVRLLRSTHR
jgi:hypothetical protein